MDTYNKISSSDTSQGIISIQQASRSPKIRKVAPQLAPQGDRVQISQKAREMQAALSQIKQMPDVDEEKVSRIKAQIQAGTYKPDSGTLAEKILAESLLGE
jgi:negative regulator of flagellin synthesis FlgM